jgi:hypothetical protein
VIVLRHIFGVVMGILVAPALLWGSGWGFVRAGELKAQSGANLFVALGAMAAAGLVLGALMVAQWASPLATLLPGLGLVAWTIVYAVNPGRAGLELPFGDDVLRGMETLLVTGVYGLLGLALLIPTFTPSRWRAKALSERDADYF